MDDLSFKFFRRLSEKEQRLFAGLEASREGWHGVQEASAFYGVHPHTIRRGKRELAEGSGGPPDRVRRAGGGRKRAEEIYPGLDAAFLEILKEHTAGDPMEVNLLWTNLGDKAISARLKERGFPVGVSIVKRLLKKHHYRRRKAVKTKTFQSVPERNAQFEKIVDVGEAERQSPNPLLSIDTKKKNILGRCIGRDRST